MVHAGLSKGVSGQMYTSSKKGFFSPLQTAVNAKIFVYDLIN